MINFPETLYRRGIAVGEADIRNDEMHFRFRKELFSFSTYEAMEFTTHNGYWYEAPVSKLRELAKRKH